MTSAAGPGAWWHRRGLWQRLMLLIVTTVLGMWLALSLTLGFFARFQSDFRDLSASQVPRIALTGELAGHSAKLAEIVTRILVGEGDGAALLAEVAEVSDRLDAALQNPLLHGQPTDSPGFSTDALQSQLAALLAQVERRQALAEGLLLDIEALRWLNVDIQDEVDPLLDDYDFNVRAKMLTLETEDRDFARAALVAQIGLERRMRDLVAALGGDAGIAVTLMLQAAVATDAAEVEQLGGLVFDRLARLRETAAALPRRTEFLTLHQSIDRLHGFADPPQGLIDRRRDWIALQATIYANIQTTQDGISALQGYLARLAENEKETVLATIDTAASRAGATMGWLLGLTLVMGATGLALVVGAVRRGIVMPLRALIGKLLAISESHDTDLRKDGERDEIDRIRHAVEEFARAFEARDAALQELEKTQADLVQAGKMAALGNLSAGISHELNQPLAALRYRLVLLEAAQTDGNAQEVARQVARARDLTERMDAIITHLRRFARRADNRREVLHLGELIDNAVSLVANRIAAAGVTLTVGPGARVATALGDPILAEQVIINLLSNALDAIAEADRPGEIVIDAADRGDAIDLNVRDNGIGLGDLTPEEAVNPFVTTKEAGRGIGLGLSISYNIARDMGGDLGLAPAPGGGVEARFRLPSGKQHG